MQRRDNSCSEHSVLPEALIVLYVVVVVNCADTALKNVVDVAVIVEFVHNIDIVEI